MPTTKKPGAKQRHRIAVRVAGRFSRDAQRELDEAAHRFSTAREAKRRADRNLSLIIQDAEKAGAL